MTHSATAVSAPPHVRHEPPAAVRTRGVLAVIAGAGESDRVYDRFGRRLCADGYLVGVFETSRAADAADWLAAGAHGEPADHTPRVLIGSDRGAAAALALAARGAVLDGVIVAGTPVGAEGSAAGDVAIGAIDASARTACPVHLGVLGGADAHAKTEAPAVAVPDVDALRGIRVPVLAVHGGADTVAPFAAARAALAAIPSLELVETVGGLHDALNDQSHRSVAATVVLWLERLRGAGVCTPIVREVTA